MLAGAAAGSLDASFCSNQRAQACKIGVSAAASKLDRYRPTLFGVSWVRKPVDLYMVTVKPSQAMRSHCDQPALCFCSNSGK